MVDGDRRPTAVDLLRGEVPLTDPLLCARTSKAELESANSLAQLDYIEYLISRLGVDTVRESHVLQLQELAVKGIYPCAGKYRDARQDVYLTRGGHRVPEAALVPSYVDRALDRLERDRLAGKNAIERAAYALWRFNWIHPFAGGNGRTARSIAYLIVCIDSGGLLLGKPTVPTIIASRTDDYEAALREADAADRCGQESLAAMRGLILSAYIDQVASALDEGEGLVQ
jgi:Fic family protein